MTARFRRRFAIGFAAVLFALGAGAAPAEATTVRITVANSGTDPVLVQASDHFTLTITSGCAVPDGPVIAVCLPGGATLFFFVNI